MPEMYDQSQPLYPPLPQPGAPPPQPQMSPSGIFGNIGRMLGHGVANAQPMYTPGGPQWGIAPSLPGFSPATYAPPPLPHPGQASSITGAPLTPNSTGLPYPAIPPSTNWGNPGVAGWEASMNLINAQQGKTALQRQYEAALPQKWNAEGNVLDARSRALTAQSGYLSEQARANAARMSAQQGITAAQQNGPNLIAAARGQRERDANDFKFRIAGLPTPIDITLPDNFSGDLPPGVRERIETIADKLTRQETNTDKMRQFNLEAARIATAAAGEEVTAADIAAGKVSLSLEGLEQAVRLAGLDVGDAELAAQATKLPPAPGLSWDEDGNQWVNTSSLKDIQMRREAIKDGPLGAFSIDQLISLLNGGKVSPDQFRDTVKQKFGFLDSTVDYLLQLAELRKGSQAAELDPRLGGQQIPAQKPNQQPPVQQNAPTPSGGSPLSGQAAGRVAGNIFR